MFNWLTLSLLFAESAANGEIAGKVSMGFKGVIGAKSANCWREGYAANGEMPAIGESPEMGSSEANEDGTGVLMIGYTAVIGKGTTWPLATVLMKSTIRYPNFVR